MDTFSLYWLLLTKIWFEFEGCDLENYFFEENFKVVVVDFTKEI